MKPFSWNNSWKHANLEIQLLETYTKPGTVILRNRRESGNTILGKRRSNCRTHTTMLLKRNDVPRNKLSYETNLNPKQFLERHEPFGF